MDKQLRQKIENVELKRTVSIVRQAIDEEARTVEIAFSSEEPYRRWFGDEILSHDKDAVDLSFLSSGRAPFLADHNHTDVIGVIEKAWIDKDRKGRALVRFGKSPRATEFFDDVVDGIRSNVSVGYVVKKWEVDEEPETPVYTAKKWCPLENSLVSIPADTSVGVGRSAEAPEIKEKEVKKMTEIEVVEKVDVDAVKAQAAKEAGQAEVARIKEITAMGKRRGFEKEADEFISSGKTVSMFRDFVWEQEENKEDISVEDVVESATKEIRGKVGQG